MPDKPTADLPMKPHTETPVELTVVDTKLEAAVQQAGLEPASAQGLIDAFRPLFAKANEICATASNLTVTDATQVTEIKQARALRLALRAVRVEAEKKRKGLKEDSLRRGKAIDGVYNVLEYAVAPVETRLLEMEEIAERAEAARKSALKATREELLKPFGIDVAFYSLADMPETSFVQLLENTKAAHAAKIEAARKAEEDRIAREKAELAERERVRLENERLKKEAEQKEEALALERARVAKEQAEAAAAAKAELDRREALAAEERKKADAAAAEIRRVAKEASDKAEAETARLKEEARLAEIKARTDAIKAKAVADEAIRKEREAREKIEREALAARQAEELRHKNEAAEAARVAAAPDREKLTRLAGLVRTLEIPEMSTKAGTTAGIEASRLIESLALSIEQLAANLGKKQ